VFRRTCNRSTCASSPKLRTNKPGSSYAGLPSPPPRGKTSPDPGRYLPGHSSRDHKSHFTRLNRETSPRDARRCTTRKRVHPLCNFAFRRTATRFRPRGNFCETGDRDLLTISRLLGHASFTTTMVYLHCRREHLTSVPVRWIGCRCVNCRPINRPRRNGGASDNNPRA